MISKCKYGVIDQCGDLMWWVGSRDQVAMEGNQWMCYCGDAMPQKGALELDAKKSQAGFFDLDVGQSPLFYIFDTPWFLIPHSSTDTPILISNHVIISNPDTITSSNQCKCNKRRNAIRRTIEPKDILKPNTLSWIKSVFHCFTHFYNII